MSRFVHLHLHSEYSLSDGTVRIGQLVERLQQLKMPAVALTDWSNMYGSIKFYRACLAAGIKPILGCDVWIESPLQSDDVQRAVLLAINLDGMRALNVLLSNAYLKGRTKNKVVISWKDLSCNCEKLIMIVDAWQGALASDHGGGDDKSKLLAIDHYQQLFDDRLYLEICRVGKPGEESLIEKATAIANRNDIGLVATNRVQFIREDEFDAHEIRVCIHDGRTLDDGRRARNFTPEQYLRSADEMCDLFADQPEAIANTVEIARRCNVFIEFNCNYLPDFTKDDSQPVEELLRSESESGLSLRLGVKQLYDSHGHALVDPQYLTRLNLELDVIIQMGFAGYFLIVADFIRWARENDIPVGPCRGSGAGSLVAWATGITELDPLRYGLLFERFLNPERVSLPDFDIDFCMDGRDSVIEYVANRYGRQQVSQIITFGTMAARAVVRDVGRVMGMTYGHVDQVAKLIPFEIGITLDKALENEEALQKRYIDEPEIRELIDNARMLEGLARNVGKHAGGVVIAPRPLTEYTPLYAESRLSQAITHLDKDDLEAIGLIKFDFLGLRTLTVIDSAVKLINRQREDSNWKKLDINQLPLDDVNTFQLICSGKTTAIFQLESRGMKELIMRLKPDHFNDLVALVALFRPGPLQSGMVDDFINRRHGLESVRYPHPDLEEILKPTYGVILYQEQVMQIAQTLSGYSLGGADLLRRAMGKKKPAEMAEHRTMFMNGAIERGVKDSVAKMIFDLIEKFAGYGFNKSHSAAYALLAYQTAWLKTHHPAAFMAATLSADLDNTDRIVILLSDCADQGIEVLLPDVNRCGYSFESLSENIILYGLGAIKGIGQSVCEAIAYERERNGAYHDLLNFCRRLKSVHINKRTLEALIKSGAMDSLGKHRAALMAEVTFAIKAAGQLQQSAVSGQSDLFGSVDSTDIEQSVVEAPEWARDMRLTLEKETLGLYLTGHPFDECAHEFVGFVDSDLRSIDLSKPKNGIFAGLLIAMRVINTRRGKMAFVTLDNASERLEVSVYADLYTSHQSDLLKDHILIVQGELTVDDFSGGCQMRAENIYTLEGVRRNYLLSLEMMLKEEQLDGHCILQMQEIMSQHLGGNTSVLIQYRKESGETGKLELGKEWKISVDRDLLTSFNQLVSAENLLFHYAGQQLRNGTTLSDVRVYKQSEKSAVS